MKLTMTSSYMNELRETFCNGDTDYVGAYAIKTGLFMAKSFALFVKANSIIVVRLGSLTLDVKENYTINKEDIENIKVSKRLLFNKVKIKTKDGKKHAFDIQKNVWTLKENQTEVFERLSRY